AHGDRRVTRTARLRGGTGFGATSARRLWRTFLHPGCAARHRGGWSTTRGAMLHPLLAAGGGAGGRSSLARPRKCEVVPGPDPRRVHATALRRYGAVPRARR